MSVLARPIVLLGMQRSGTTWLGGLLGANEEVAYWVEPRQVWMMWRWWSRTDRLTEAEATPLVRRQIRATFERFVKQRGRLRFCEKTPSNCLRVPFVRAVFPDARFVVLLRDARATVASSGVQAAAGPSWERIAGRVRETPIWMWPAFFDRIPWLYAKMAGRPVSMWGVRPPGWHDWVDLDTHEIYARQWAESVSIMLGDLESIPDQQKITTRYEDLISSPRQEARRIAEFCELARAQDFVEHVCSTARGRSSTPGPLIGYRHILEPVMNRAGYEW